MRESCFRGKRIPHGEWVEGSLHIEWGETDKDGNRERDYRILGMRGECDYIDPDTVGEFSGKRDKNDRRIFEGDIGRYRQTDGAKRNGTSILCTGKVIYNTETASYAVESRDEAGCRYFDYFPIKDFEVIGNIYDNPEMLKQEVQ